MRAPFLGLAGVAMACLMTAAVPTQAQQRIAAVNDTVLAAQACNVCHGSATYVSPTMPPIHGADAGALYSALIDFKTDKRPYTIMGRIARGYSDEQLKALADYLSKN
ncbi:hypothetical protein [Ferrovibrio terrae]|uniref:c-type cytochrome n=1 Tax=Ferrovibrio terrae TaxID=2594003 RepID=UPI003137FEDE